MRWIAIATAISGLGAALVTSGAALADSTPSCSVLQADLTPTSDLQIVMWLEDASGNYIDTIFITQQTGRYGLGNRPGRYDFNSGPLWPYGRRVTTFPVWSHRHGMTFPEVDFQMEHHVCCGDENALSHSQDISSPDAHFCKPRIEHQEGWDGVTCASASGLGPYTDKGIYSPTATSLYPPRTDIVKGGQDSPSVDMYKLMDPFDAVSQATPPGGVTATVTWHVPAGLPNGSYVLWTEVSKETQSGDPDGNSNATYNASVYPAPVGIAYGNYGIPNRGQPSVVYSAPFVFGGTTTASTSDYAGYGDPEGQDGTLNPPDSTITTAAGRLQLVAGEAGATYRVRVRTSQQQDAIPPGPATEAAAVDTTATSATISFIAPGDDGLVGKVSAYQVRYLALASITDANFDAATPVAGTVTPDDPGQVQLVDVSGLLPSTLYSVGIRAIDDCGNVGPLTVTSFTTKDRQFGEVDACFIATAAYGSIMANDVDLLRGFRDRVLQQSTLGELAVETYYTFGPPMAQVVGSSDLLRSTAREALGPAVELARGLLGPRSSRAVTSVQAPAAEPTSRRKFTR